MLSSRPLGTSHARVAAVGTVCIPQVTFLWPLPHPSPYPWLVPGALMTGESEGSLAQSRMRCLTLKRWS